jgi:2-polyprenyl-3-methyl-5-hydroxy-6-metoxy-1,4-benzoquinol methylase
VTDAFAIKQCAICGARARVLLPSPRLAILRCPDCGHQQGVHAPCHSLAVDYHAQYEQHAFLESLRQTRVRQASFLLDLIREHAPGAHRILDFGCGRGWFLEAAARSGFDALAGADSSAMAVAGIRDRGMEALVVPSDEPERVELRSLSFRPQVLTLLDVVEHFPPAQAVRVLATLVGKLHPELRLVVIKVPDSHGLLYRAATFLARFGRPAMLEQLYQVGTSPPHLSYFSAGSLQRLLETTSLRPLTRRADLDFEPENLGDRARALGSVPRWLTRAAGAVLARVALTLRMEDSLIYLAIPTTRSSPVPGTGASA